MTAAAGNAVVLNETPLPIAGGHQNTAEDIHARKKPAFQRASWIPVGVSRLLFGGRVGIEWRC
jgi:hypothetical protein